jgi:hypothetical protein
MKGGLFMTLKFKFRIRTRNGLLVDKLVIHGQSLADAERKLRQMYPRCEIVEPADQTGVARMLARRGGVPSVLPGK